MGKSNQCHKIGLRTVAVIEAAKGVGVLALCLLLLFLLDRDLNQLAAQLNTFLRLHPDSRLADWTYNMADRVTGRDILIAFSIGCVYVIGRFVEAYGLWRQRLWGEWMAVITGGIYLPLELYAIVRNPSLINFLILAANLLVVLYILSIMLDNRRRRKASQHAAAAEAGVPPGSETAPGLRRPGARDVHSRGSGFQAKFEARD
jgi:uncharacterized membrane protein (DUF2068 family)